MRIPFGDCCTGEDRFYGDNVNEDPVVTDMVMPGQEHGFHLLSVKPPRTCFQMSRSEPGVLGGGTAGSFDGLLCSICFSRALLVVYSDFP